MAASYLVARTAGHSFKKKKKKMKSKIHEYKN